MRKTVRMLGRRVRAARERLSLSIEEFAQEIDVPPERLRRIESGEVEIGAASLGEAARLVGWPVEFFLNGRMAAAVAAE